MRYNPKSNVSALAAAGGCPAEHVFSTAGRAGSVQKKEDLNRQGRHEPRLTCAGKGVPAVAGAPTS